jgi:hypothetical protein
MYLKPRNTQNFNFGDVTIHVYDCYSYGGTEFYKKSSRCSGRRTKTEGQAEIEMVRWCDGRYQEVGGKKLEECC